MKKRHIPGTLAAGALLFALGAASPAYAADDLITNGTFGSVGQPDGSYLIGEQFDGWTVTAANAGLANFGLQVWWTMPVAGPFPNGAYAGVQGTISQSIPTVVGTTYRLTFQHRASADSTDAANPAWQGGVSGAAVVGGVAHPFTTTKTPIYTPQEVVFTATGTSTLVEFTTADAVGIDDVSVFEVPVDPSPIMIPAIAGGLGLVALAGGVIHLVGRKIKQAA